jgi:hypothetical protein
MAKLGLTLAGGPRWSPEPRAWGEILSDDEVFGGYRDLYGLDDLQGKHVWDGCWR